METQFLILLLLLFKQDAVWSVLIKEMQAPSHVSEGADVLLGCTFDLQGDTLYSVKWYKGDGEFYRYVPRSKTGFQTFYQEGVEVDVSRSSRHEVTLVNVSRDSAGWYSCEVRGEAPLFATASVEKYISVQLVSGESPLIEGAQNEYRVGEIADVNCTSLPSRPETQLSWWLNDVLAPAEYLRGPVFRHADTSDATYTTLQLLVRLLPDHFHHGVIELKCKAMLPPLHFSEAVHRARLPQFGSREPIFDDPEEPGEPEMADHSENTYTNIGGNDDTGSDAASSLNSSLILLLLFSQCFLLF